MRKTPCFSGSYFLFKVGEIDSTRKNTARLVFLAILAMVLALGGGAYFGNAFNAEQAPSVLRIGVLPDDDPAVLRRRYASLLDYLAAKTGIETRLVIPADYADAIRRFADGDVDLAYFGGLTFVQAHASYGAQPLVMRNVDTRFVSWFVVKPENGQLALNHFAGKSISFGDRLSTSGHLMPRHFLQRHWDIDADNFFSRIEYSGAHDKTVMKVLDGEVEIGAVNSVTVKNMLSTGRIDEEELHVLWETPPYPDYVWATSTEIKGEIRNSLRDAFLELDSGIPSHLKILNQLNAHSFLPANSKDFRQLKTIALNLDLMQDVSK